ncbi:hypothetical protein ZIOFF_026692 [Zingiber officinale]|uniref:Wbp11/ELF5/Saf1 N-terminal domain-containing protein n=1 Tax=Zingiber officinale TaxID=94328 RepID=A0A8J5H565_ZINOF|nr:hypothetical protein ZIOFF_026692 [Zingiber officinale]
MAEEKESTSIPLSQATDPEDPAKAPPISPSSSTRKACGAVLQSWVSKKFMTGWKDVCRLQTINLAAICTPADYHTRPLDTIFSNFIDALPVVSFETPGLVHFQLGIAQNNKCVIHFSTYEVYGKTIGSFIPNDHPLRKNKKERKKVCEVGILKKDPEAIREQIEKMERMSNLQISSTPELKLMKCGLSGLNAC